MSGGRVEVAVIGGGPAGAAAAIRLAAAGREVLVFERERGPHHVVCGEFLSAEAVADLRALGVDIAALGATRIDRVRLTANGRSAAARLPFVAAGLSRKALDAALLDKAAASGATIRRGARVRRVEAAGGGWTIGLACGGEITAGAVLLATGKYDLPGVARATPWRGRSDMLALKMHLRLPESGMCRLRGVIELHLLPGGYAGLQLVEEGWANLCMVLDGKTCPAAGADFGRLLREIGDRNACLAEALAGAVPAWPRPLAIARVPYGHRFALPSPGAPGWRLGDQAAVTPSFTGDGLAIALRSGVLAADHMLEGRSGEAFAAAMRAETGRQMRWAMLLQGMLDRPRSHALAIAAAQAFPPLIAWGSLRTRLRMPPAPSGHPA